MRRLWLVLLALCAATSAARADELRIGSKKFTESVILADIAADLAASTGASVRHHQELGGTRILWDALLAGDVDLYPEYTGTLTREILVGENVHDEAGLGRALAARGLRMSKPLGFDDTYALGMMPKTAERLRVATISDLARIPGLSFGLGNEFLRRSDGWLAVQRAYSLNPSDVRGFDHDLAYRALATGAVDVTDVYTTDAEIGYYGIKVLADDRRLFPEYQAVFVYRADLEKRFPAALRAILGLEGRIDAPQMIAMNEAAKIQREPEVAIAARFVGETFGIRGVREADGLARRLLRRTGEHLTLTLVSLGAAILIALPLGIVAARRPRLGQAVMAMVGIVQTIPSLALLVFMIPLLGIGGPPATAALFLYSLLPIVRNTAAGLGDIPPSIRNSAIALGLTPMRRLRRVELPMASPAILAGIKTAAVINVGTATLGALIGAGGYGQPILAGIRLDDFGLILEGAIPAAVLALFVQGAFEAAERFLVPRGLRLKPSESL